MKSARYDSEDTRSCQPHCVFEKLINNVNQQKLMAKSLTASKYMALRDN